MNEDNRKAVALDDEDLKAVLGGVGSQVQIIVDPEENLINISQIYLTDNVPGKRDRATTSNNINDRIMNL